MISLQAPNNILIATYGNRLFNTEHWTLPQLLTSIIPSLVLEGELAGAITPHFSLTLKKLKLNYIGWQKVTSCTHTKLTVTVQENISTL